MLNKLELLKSFVRVSEMASFTQAAQSLGIPKSTVSEHIQLLETLVGARLLHRTTRRVRATQDGLMLYPRAKEMLATMDELEGAFREQQQLLSGRIRIDMPTAFARFVVIPQLTTFLQRHPAIEVEISCTDRRVDLVREGFDCVIRIGDAGGNGHGVRPLGQLAMINVASPAYLATHGVPQGVADLPRHVLVEYVQVLGMPPAGFNYQQNGETLTIIMPSQVTVNNADAYEAACLGGLGIIQAPCPGFYQHLRDGSLVEVLTDLPPAPMDISLLYAHPRQLSQRVRRFMDWLEEVIRPHVVGKV